jgi:hypothetical protein
VWQDRHVTDAWVRPDLKTASTASLLELHAAVMIELRAREVIRTQNPPAGDYGEWLVVRGLGGDLVKNSEKSYDVANAEHGRIQVKTRMVSTPVRPGQLQTSPFRSDGFSHAAFVQLADSDFAVVRASLVPVDVVRQVWRERAHVNGRIVMMTPTVMAHPKAIDITGPLRAAALDA